MVLKVGTDFGTCPMAKYGRPAWKIAVQILTGKGFKKEQRHEKPKMRYSIAANSFSLVELCQFTTTKEWLDMVWLGWNA